MPLCAKPGIGPSDPERRARDDAANDKAEEQARLAQTRPLGARAFTKMRGRAKSTIDVVTSLEVPIAYRSPASVATPPTSTSGSKATRDLRYAALPVEVTRSPR